MKKEKGRLKKWLKSKGKDALGNTLDVIGENTSIPVLSSLIEGIGEKLMSDPNLSEQDKQEAAEIIKQELEYYKIEQQEISKRWDSDSKSGNVLAKTARPITLHFISLLILTYFITGYCGVVVPEEYSSLLKVLVPVVYGGYFALREFGKHSERKNR